METEVMEELGAIIQKHAVHYRIWPRYEICDHKRLMVGFNFELHGTLGHGNMSLSPECPVSTATYADLRRLAEWMLPKQEYSSRFEIPPFDRSLHTCSVKGPREVVVPIQIEHRDNRLRPRPVDDCQHRCLRKMQQKLAEMGVRPSA